MKNNLLFYLLFTAIVSSYNTTAQTIPNADFETWSNSLPTGWWDAGVYSNTGASVLSQSSDHQSGTWAVKLQPLNYMGVYTFPALLITNNGNMLATNLKPAYLNGYFKSSLLSTDTFMVVAEFQNSATTTSRGGADLSHTSYSAWTPFHVTLSYSSGFTPDSFGVAVELKGSTSSYACIDNLSFSNTPIGIELGTPILLGIKDIHSSPVLTSSSINPNPASGLSEISFMISASSPVTINIYDLTGRLVKNILNETITSGTHAISFNADEFHSGIYFYTISGNGFYEAKKFIVNK